jgi:hypothetical protein
VIENQQQNNIQMNTKLILPPKWTETITPTITRTLTVPPAETETLTITETDTPVNESLRYYETAYTPHFSYIPPRGWKKVFKPSVGSKFKEATSWMTFDHKCLLNFWMIAAGTVTSKEYLINQMNEAKPNTIISEGSFPNVAGLDTYRAVVQFTSMSPIIMYYIFHQGVFVLEGIYSCDKGNSSLNDTLIDQTMDSVQFET